MSALPARNGRDAAGRWLAGVSGNPKGADPALRKVTELARERTSDAIETLHKIALDPEQPAMARVRASEVLLDRGWGKAAAVADPEDESGGVVSFFFALGETATGTEAEQLTEREG